MKQTLRRTDTVGTKYALHIWTGFLVVLSLLMAGVLLTLNTELFVWVAAAVIVWSTAGILVSAYALSRIQNLAAQVKADIMRLKMLINSSYGRYPQSRPPEDVRAD